MDQTELSLVAVESFLCLLFSEQALENQVIPGFLLGLTQVLNVEVHCLVGVTLPVNIDGLYSLFRNILVEPTAVR